jgi:hypothetical protein
MNPEAVAATPFAVRNGLNQQIWDMHFVRHYSAEQISSGLSVPVADVLIIIQSAPKKFRDKAGDKQESLAKKTMEGMSKHLTNAMNRLGVLIDDEENPHIAFAASKFTVEVCLGKHLPPRPETGGGNTIENFNQTIVVGNQAAEKAEQRLLEAEKSGNVFHAERRLPQLQQPQMIEVPAEPQQ